MDLQAAESRCQNSALSLPRTYCWDQAFVSYNARSWQVYGAAQCNDEPLSKEHSDFLFSEQGRLTSFAANT